VGGLRILQPAVSGADPLRSSRVPVTQNAMTWRSSDVIGGFRDQLSAPQMCERGVDGAFG